MGIDHPIVRSTQNDLVTLIHQDDHVTLMHQDDHVTLMHHNDLEHIFFQE